MLRNLNDFYVAQACVPFQVAFGNRLAAGGRERGSCEQPIDSTVRNTRAVRVGHKGGKAKGVQWTFHTDSGNAEAGEFSQPSPSS